MGKKKTAPVRASEPLPKQQRLPGTDIPVPRKVQDLCDRYVDSKRQTAEWRARTNGIREDLIAAMKEAGIETLEVDDGEKLLRQVDKPTVEIKSRKAVAQDKQDEELS